MKMLLIARALSSSVFDAKPLPCPPSVYAALIITGNPSFPAAINCVINALNSNAARGFNIYFIKLSHKKLPVFSIHYCSDRSPKNLYIIFFKYSCFEKLGSAVQSGLASE